MKLLQDMDWEEAEPIVKAWHNREPVERHTKQTGWMTYIGYSLFGNDFYRLPVIPMTINFSHLHDDIMYVAADENGEVYGYIEKPLIDEDTNSWFCKDLIFLLSGVVKSLDRGTCDWDVSLIERGGPNDTGGESEHG